MLRWRKLKEVVEVGLIGAGALMRGARVLALVGRWGCVTPDGVEGLAAKVHAYRLFSERRGLRARSMRKVILEVLNKAGVSGEYGRVKRRNTG